MKEKIPYILFVILFFELAYQLLFSVFSAGSWEQSRVAWQASAMGFVFRSFWYPILLGLYFAFYQFALSGNFFLPKKSVYLHISIVGFIFMMKILPIPFPFSYFISLLLKLSSLLIFVIIIYQSYSSGWNHSRHD